jgi:hypothetical protein
VKQNGPLNCIFNKATPRYTKEPLNYFTEAQFNTMDNSRRENSTNEPDTDTGATGWGIGLLGLGAAALAAGTYFLLSGSANGESTNKNAEVTWKDFNKLEF